MKPKVWTNGLWLGTMGLFLILIPFWLLNNPDPKLIDADPRDFLLKPADLGPVLPCTFDAHLQQKLTNDAIIYLMGDQAGAKRVRDTGRLTGWRESFMQARCKNGGPDEINQSVMQFSSVQGAQLNLRRYALSVEHPETWQQQYPTPDLGDQALVEKRVGFLPGGKQRVTYALSFTYLNIGARIEVSGLTEAVSLELATALAERILEKLEAAQPCAGPVPTPTVGFEPRDPGISIYR